jgi:ketosteroid isomerase-like protein
MRDRGVLFESFIFDATYRVDEFQIEGDWAFDRGVWNEKRTRKDNGEKTEIPFGIVQIYRRDKDGVWKLARMVWNTDAPPFH